MPSKSTLETITASAAPLEDVFLPPYVSDETKRVLAGVLSGKSKSVDLRCAFGGGLGNGDTSEVNQGGGFISGFCLFPNGAAVGRMISVAAQGLHRGTTIAGIITGWLSVVAKLRTEVERGRWLGEETLVGVDGAGVGGWEGWGIVAQKVALIGEAVRAKKSRDQAESGYEVDEDKEVNGGDFKEAEEEYHDAHPDLPQSPVQKVTKKTESMDSTGERERYS